MDSHWQTVDNIRTKSNLTPQDVIDLEFAMLSIVSDLGTEIHHKNSGYSVRLPRYRLRNNCTGNLAELRLHYRAHHRELRLLGSLVERLEHAAQRSCAHVWERDLSDRGHRSTYYCRKCGKYR